MRFLELYCGIGGLAEAVKGHADVVLAVDQSPLALRFYAANFPHRTLEKTIHSVDDGLLRNLDADIWWASPPCQPFTRKGRKRYLKDPRAATFEALLRKVEHHAPAFFVLENVPGFKQSPARARLLEVVERTGYGQVREAMLCPTQFGVPNRRERYFIVAAREMLHPARPPVRAPGPLIGYLEKEPNPRFTLPPEVVDRFRYAMDIVRPHDPDAVSACFGGGYGRSMLRSGSYIECADGGLRRFAPAEMLRLLGFGSSYRLPDGISDRQAWRIIGNSLSIPCVRQVLSWIPGYADVGWKAPDDRSVASSASG